MKPSQAFKNFCSKQDCVKCDYYPYEPECASEVKGFWSWMAENRYILQGEYRNYYLRDGANGLTCGIQKQKLEEYITRFKEQPNDR